MSVACKRSCQRKQGPPLTALLLVAFCVCSTYVSGQQSAPKWTPATMPIACWCTPPDPYITKEQYRHMADAGFTVVLPPCSGEATVARNHKILVIARDTGLKAIIADARMPTAITGVSGAKEALQRIVQDYRKSPALLGYFLTDEPGAGQFAGLAEVANYLHELDPDHLVYINLFPNYATDNRMAMPSQLGTESYDQYLDRYMKAVKPDVLSFDSYGFLQSGDRPGYLGNLAAVQRATAAQDAGQIPTPFWQVILSVQHGPYRKLTLNELRYEALQALVYGAHGLVYFTYWLPDDPTFQWSNGIVNRDGTNGPLYDAVTQVNREVKTLARWLYGAWVIGTYQTGNVPPDGRPLSNEVPVTISGQSDLSLALFRDVKGYLYVMVTNRNYQVPADTSLSLDAGKHAIEMLDIATNRWQPVKIEPDADGRTTLKLTLGPADAALIRWF